VNGDHYYLINGTTPDGYEDGELRFWNNTESSWDTPDDSMAQDISFRIIGEVETTALISDIVDEGEFFVDTEVLKTTGVYSYPYRNGDAVALYELEELLKIGTADNTRLLARVTENRVLQVYEEPPAGSADHYVNKEGLVTDQYDNEIHLASCPVAYWVQLKDIVPVSVDVSKISNASRLFVEQSEYDAQKGIYKIKQARDSATIIAPLSNFKGSSPSLNQQYRYNQG